MKMKRATAECFIRLLCEPSRLCAFASAYGTN
jgi:hypothetical protein